jgi:hypothetical protein
MPESVSRFAISTAVALIAVVLFATAIFSGYHVASYQGTDENGYLLTAKRLATDGDIAKRTEGPNEFVGSNWVEAKEDVFYAKYPIGYPALCAVAYKLGGPSAVFLVNPVLAVLAVAGMFFLGRAMLNDFAGALAAIFLATNPMHAFYGISALSHTGAICFAIWGMYFIWRWAERGGWWNAILGAAFTAYTPSVRYTEALLVLPALAMVVWRCVETWRSASSANKYKEHPSPDLSPKRRGTSGSDATPIVQDVSTLPSVVSSPLGGEDKGEGSVSTTRPRPRLRLLPWGQLVVMALVGIVVLSPLLIQHWVAYGSPFTSGYSLCGESTGFGWKWFDKNWKLMLNRMDTPGLFLIFPLGIAGLGYLVVHRPRLGVFLALWAIPSLLLYTAYYWAPEGDGPWYIRFFVSIFPPLIVSALALLCVAVKSRPAWNIVIGLFAILVAGVNLNETGRQLDKKVDGLVFAKTLMETVHEKLPNGSVVLSDESVLNYIEFAGNYKLYSTGAYERSSLLGRTKVLKDNEPHPFQRKKAKDIEDWLGNKTDAQLNDLLQDRLARQLADGHSVYVIASQGNLSRWRGRLSDRFQFSLIDECVEAKVNQKGEVNVSSWSLHELKPVSADALTVAKASKTLETKVDQMRFRIDVLRSEYNQQFPGAKESMAKITDMEKQMRDTQEELKRARQKEKTLAKSP